MKFNKWSREKIAAGLKWTTARTKPHHSDPDVSRILPGCPWYIIRDWFYQAEGASCPSELQDVINGIFARSKKPVMKHRVFYLHILTKTCIERIKKEVVEE